MPTKSARKAALPAGVLPLLTMPQLETYFDVSDWTVLRWIEDGMPVVVLATTGRKTIRRFDLLAVKAWHAEQAALQPTA